TEAKLWIGYIDTLIKSGKPTEAKKILDLAKSKGASGKEFYKLDFQIRLMEIRTSKAGNAIGIDPPMEFQNEIRNAYLDEDYETVVWMSEKLFAFYPKCKALLNTQGQASVHLGNYAAAIRSFGMALDLDPKSPEMLNNLGHAHYKMGDNDKAIEVLKKALRKKPNYSIALNNLGIALDKKGALIQAKKYYQKAINSDLKNTQAYNNLAVSMSNCGQIDEAKRNYKRTLELDPCQVASFCNLQSLIIQSSEQENAKVSADLDFLQSRDEFKMHVLSHPKSCSLEALRLFITGDFKRCLQKVNLFHQMDSNLINKNLEPKDRRFCINYNRFIRALALEGYKYNNSADKKVFHLGESHCLSYAHRIIDIDNLSFQIVPKICFGVKAFHLGKKGNNIYKTVIKNHLHSIPRKSNVFVSIGEIDCRIDEGILEAAKKYNTSLKPLVIETVSGYLKWIRSINKSLQHRIFLLNVPAPVYSTGIRDGLNEKRAEVVQLFNEAMAQEGAANKVNIVDVYGLSKGERGFSNMLFHIDNYHLGPKALTHLQKQCAEK
ncbi:MAG: tetratricopeptide repeat protein, partial [Paracoccaceae bacterium]